ncbi:MAG: heme biosynthesis protein HemY [Betaproteobacteria bacterium]|nr:heme biosynthesis protein HemY [Betaproteobacteria bacterium]
MKGLFWVVAVFAAAVALAIFGRFEGGYAIFYYPPYRIDMSLLLFAFLALAGVALLYAGLRLAHHVLAIPGYVRAYRARRRAARAHEALAAAMRGLFEGRYAHAEKGAARAHEAGISPGLAALIAARATHALREYARSEEWLERAVATGESIEAAYLTTRAEMALDERNYGAARDALHRLHDNGPRHLATLRLLLRAERGTGNWEEVLRIAAQLAKREAISPALAEEYKVQATIELLARAAVERVGFEQRWRRIAGSDQVHPRIAAAGARHAAALGAAQLSCGIIEKALAVEWSAPLVALYGDLSGFEAALRRDEARSRIERAEKWLVARPSDAPLLVTLGRLCAHAELWGKAQSYLEASLAFDDSRAAHLDLARLLVRLGRDGEAQKHFRLAAELP